MMTFQIAGIARPLGLAGQITGTRHHLVLGDDGAWLQQGRTVHKTRKQDPPPHPQVCSDAAHKAALVYSKAAVRRHARHSDALMRASGARAWRIFICSW